MKRRLKTGTHYPYISSHFDLAGFTTNAADVHAQYVN